MLWLSVRALPGAALPTQQHKPTHTHGAGDPSNSSPLPGLLHPPGKQAHFRMSVINYANAPDGQLQLGTFVPVQGKWVGEFCSKHWDQLGINHFSPGELCQ